MYAYTPHRPPPPQRQADLSDNPFLLFYTFTGMGSVISDKIEIKTE